VSRIVGSRGGAWTSVPWHSPSSVRHAVVAPDRLIEALYQRLVVKRLAQKSGRSGTPHPRFDLLPRGRRHKDNGDGTAPRNQVTLQLDTAQTWHLDIRDQTRCRFNLIRP